MGSRAIRRVTKWCISISLAGMLAACMTTVPVDSHDYGMVTSGDFSFMNKNVKTYSWHPNSERAYLANDIDSTEVTDMVKKAIETEMHLRGYRLQNGQRAGDVIIGFGLAEESVLKDSTIFDYTKLSTGIPFYDKNGNKVDKGSLYMVMYRPNMTQPLWQTLAQSGIEQGLAKQQRKERITTYISMILRDLPKVNP